MAGSDPKAPEAVPNVNAAEQFATVLVAHFEAFRPHVYQDQKGVWTIGYGTTFIDGVPVGPNTPDVTGAQALVYLHAGLQTAINGVDDYVHVALTDNERAALISFTYNCGVGSLEHSTMCEMLNKNDIPGATAQFLLWDHVNGVENNGLLSRRKLEQAVFAGRCTYDQFMAMFPHALAA